MGGPVIDLEKLKNDLEEVARAASQGHLTRAELLRLKVDIAWVQVCVREAVARHLHPQEPMVRNERGY